jgi:L-asparaginase
MHVHIFTTGGSIDKTYSTLASDFVVGDPQVSAVLRDANVNFEYTLTPLFRKDSLTITDDDRQHIVNMVAGSPHKHILITHGTDTMILTALALRVIKDKVIVLTGAMQPASFKDTDAHFNIGVALGALQLLQTGVYVAMNGRIFSPENTRKNTELNQFESF